VTRYISLYWASIKPSFIWACSLRLFVDVFRRRLILRERVDAELVRIFGNHRYLLFSTARGALSFYLRTLLTPGDEVVVSSYTCLAVPTAVTAAAMRPVYVDIDPDSLSINEQQLWSVVGPSTRAVVLQHTLGNTASVAALAIECRRRGILVIEDCALSVGTTIDGQYVGSFGDASIYSMELSKTISCGWGGVLQINDTSRLSVLETAYAHVPDLSRVSSLRDFLQTVLSGVFTDPRVLGWVGRYLIWLCHKCRLFRYSTSQAEIDGRVSEDFVSKIGWAQSVLAEKQWQRFGEVRSRCSRNFKVIASALEKAGFVVHRPRSPVTDPVANRVSFISGETAVIKEAFAKDNIELGTWFDGPLSPLPECTEFHYNKEDYPVALRVSKSVLNVPCHSRLSQVDLTRILSCIATVSIHAEKRSQ